MPGFDSDGYSVLAVRHKANCVVAHRVMSDLPCLARSGWNQAQCSALRGFRDYPFTIRRNRSGESLANTRRRRAIRVAQKDGVVRSSAIAFFFEQNLPAIGADVAQLRPPEPTQLPFLFAVRPFAANV